MTPFLLLSHHRSGSNFLTDTLQAHPQVSVIDEPMSMHTEFFPSVDLIRWGAEDYHPARLHASMDVAPGARSFIQDLFDYLPAAAPGQVRGFKETMLPEKLPWLLAALPDLVVVYLVRDPRSVISSVLSRDFTKLWRYEVTIPRYRALYDDVPFPIEVGDVFERCVSSWQIRHYETMRHLPRDRSLSVRLEDSLTDPERTLTRVMAALGLAPTQRQYDFIEQSQQDSRGSAYSVFRRPADVLHGWSRNLTRRQVATIESRLSREMALHGYDR
ncbi:sulfotransferase family protein [Jatrophihabitans sp.]|uniref:sulfotransferase family protein n=1 Tax=Jatrophihabitans sp. TaxID=1932789 RepID=UPI002B7DE36D|nr:sulfotransferase [Jatrophihabitans sp.]